ncbi:hypothetical protein [Geoalkalibacter sp.]|uniref:hypothetical protein n=1 Tax=Geoalkalibacter sp. TaxID=3041440 RepID=UPI00272EA209|nr:hypothetical protein [Geoalkalibacter sp.]
MRSLRQDMDEVQTLSRIFLAIFVLIGLIPFFKRSASRLYYDYLSDVVRLRKPIIAPGFAVVKRFSLSRKGRALALEKGLSVGYSEQTKRMITP